MPETGKQTAPNRAALVPEKAPKEVAYRLVKFATWLDGHNRCWLQPDLASYRDYLTEEKWLEDATVASHLSTIRRRYRDLLQDRETLVTLAGSPENLEAAILAILQAIDPATARVAPDPSRRVKFTVLSEEQYQRFLNSVEEKISRPHPGPWLFDQADLRGRRDMALIALMVMTGVRESETVRLKVSDLDYQIGRLPALRVEGARGQVRLTPYLEERVPDSVRQWIDRAGLGQGDWLFRAFDRGGRTLCDKPMQLPTIRKIQERYPFEIEPGKQVVITTTDLRATYAWHMYHRYGESVEAIAQYLGASTALVERFVTGGQNRSGYHHSGAW